MEKKEITIYPADGYKLDIENSNSEKIIFIKDNQKKNTNFITAGLPDTWKEFCEQNPCCKGEYYISRFSDIRNIISRIRDAHAVINAFRTEIVKGRRGEASAILSFQSEEIRDKFFNNFKNLIEIAKDLI